MRQREEGREGKKAERGVSRGSGITVRGSPQRLLTGKFLLTYREKPLKFVLGLPKLKFSTGKKHFTPGQKSGKITLSPQKNFPVTPLSKGEAN